MRGGARHWHERRACDAGADGPLRRPLSVTFGIRHAPFFQPHFPAVRSPPPTQELSPKLLLALRLVTLWLVIADSREPYPGKLNHVHHLVQSVASFNETGRRRQWGSRCRETSRAQRHWAGRRGRQFAGRSFVPDRLPDPECPDNPHILPTRRILPVARASMADSIWTRQRGLDHLGEFESWVLGGPELAN